MFVAKIGGGATFPSEHMNVLLSMLARVRPLLPDSAVAWGARNWFNQTHPSLGQMTTLQINSTGKKAVFDLDLKGEAQTLHVTIDRYEVTTVGKKTFVEIKEFHTSREWLNVLGWEFLKG